MEETQEVIQEEMMAQKPVGIPTKINTIDNIAEDHVDDPDSSGRMMGVDADIGPKLL